MLSNDEALKQSLEWLLEEEGGFSNHPADTGGATMFGVTQATYNSWRKARKLPQQPVKKITHDEAISLYRAMYWDEAGCDKLPFPISYMVFDAAVNSGPSRAIKWLQESIKVTQDGKIGPKTRAAVRAQLAANPGTLLYRMIDVRVSFLARLIKDKPSQIAFLHGWWRRTIRVLLRAAMTVEVE